MGYYVRRLKNKKKAPAWKIQYEDLQPVGSFHLAQALQAVLADPNAQGPRAATND